MADPRSDVVWDGIGAENVTFIIDNSTIVYSSTANYGSASVGLAVTLTTSETVALVGDGEGVLGKLISVDSDNFAVVQVKGFMMLPGGSGATLTNMKSIVGDLGASSAKGYVREVATGTAAELGVARGFIVDPTDTANVVVCL